MDLSQVQKQLIDNITEWKSGARSVGYYSVERKILFFAPSPSYAGLYDLNGFPVNQAPDVSVSKEQYEAATQ